ncbi:hypothetical protein FIBSPDRAFT_958769 [Athelia psychrophila]|uniref:ATP-dependent RNA helicase n=1 Tax=Athelia psychrophila TaxID=1759441 RepID=A0A166E649_9AGAM|nr:hypothetical protein FIBSPDRAFT_958769 [Fibularhizoctonia sp. CBS 109695]
MPQRMARTMCARASTCHEGEREKWEGEGKDAGGGQAERRPARELDRGVEVHVVAPGHLWNIPEDGDELAKQIRGLKFLMVDEANRMVEAGHFEEIPPSDETIETERLGADIRLLRTLSKDLQRNVKKRSSPRIRGKKGKGLTTLLLRLDFRDPEPAIIEEKVSPVSPSPLRIPIIAFRMCTCTTSSPAAQADHSCSCIPSTGYGTASKLEQRLRLKNLDRYATSHPHLISPFHIIWYRRNSYKNKANVLRFKGTPNSALLATDIPAVDHIIHYQIPRSADSYVHWNGRTARAMHKGFSMFMCGPNERRVVRALQGSWGRQETDMLEMNIELSMLDKLKARVALARKIDSVHPKVKKENHAKNWMKEAAEAIRLGLCQPTDGRSSDDEDDQGRPMKVKVKSRNVRTRVMGAEFKRMLTMPLIAKGCSTM